MRALISIFKMRFSLILQYRVAAIAGTGTQLFFGFVMVMVFDAFFLSTNKEMPMNLAQTVSYIWLGQALLGLLPWNGDREIQGMIRSGDISYEVIRPLDLYDYWYFRILAQRLASTLSRAIPVLLVAVLLPRPFHLSGPATLGGFLAFLVTLTFGVILGCALSNIITLSVLFTIGDGIDRIFPAVVTLFSGMIVPLAYFPDWAQIIFKVLPFSGLVDAPYRFYLGVYDLSELPIILLHQGLWTVAFIALGKWLISLAQKRIVVQGG